jgi:hypothetical protein
MLLWLVACGYTTRSKPYHHLKLRPPGPIRPE